MTLRLVQNATEAQAHMVLVAVRCAEHRSAADRVLAMLALQPLTAGVRRMRRMHADS